MRRITPLTLTTMFIVLLLSTIVFKYNDSLRIPSIFDGRFYSTTAIPPAPKPFRLPEKREMLPELDVWADSLTSAEYPYVEKFLEESNTTSFLVLRNDTIIYQRYMNGVRAGDATQVFSVTKVFITALLGIAIRDGHIPHADVPVKNYFPDLMQPKFDSLTLMHLAQMRSGLNYDEYGNLWQTLSFYYKRNLTSAIYSAEFTESPGAGFRYKSIDTQILGECIRKSLEKKNVLEYFREKLWDKLGMQDSAWFAIDSKLTRNLKYYGGLNMSGRDLAKFGVMMLHQGRFNGKRVLPRDWFGMCAQEVNRSTSDDRYCLGLYYSMDDADNDIYYAAGFNGQIMLMNASRGVIVIRLGKDKGGVNWYPLLKKLSFSV